MKRELQAKDEEYARIADLKDQGIYNVKKFGTINGYGDIYPAVAYLVGGDSVIAWYSTVTRRAYYQAEYKECSTTNYRIIKNWSRSYNRSGNFHAH